MDTLSFHSIPVEQPTGGHMKRTGQRYKQLDFHEELQVSGVREVARKIQMT
jgi:hypothetical protein